MFLFSFLIFAYYIMPSRRRTRGSRTRKAGRRRVPWAGWGKAEPRGHQRTVMYKKCGGKCFLGPNKRPHPSFPICTKGTCKVNNKGVYAAYVRARQWGKARSAYKGKSRPSMKRGTYTRIARRAKRMLRRSGTKRGGKRTRRRGRKGKKKCLRGQKRNKRGKITRHGKYRKCGGSRSRRRRR